MFDDGFKLEAAIDIAARAHEGQLRKYTGEPYIVHPFAVAGLVRSVSDDEDLFVAALLHDVVEDTQVTLGFIRGVFGHRIGDLVGGLTDVSEPEDGNREVRKGLDRLHTAQQSADVHTIKLADLIDNTKSIVAHDPNFAEVYMKEKKLLLEVLKDGDQMLWALAKQYVDDWEKPKEDKVCSNKGCTMIHSPAHCIKPACYKE